MTSRGRKRILSILLCIAMMLVQCNTLIVSAVFDNNVKLTDEAGAITESQNVTLPDTLSVSEQVYSVDEQVNSVSEQVYTETTAEPQIVEEPVEEEMNPLEEEIDLQVIEAGLENNPKPLTMDDLINDFNLQRPFMAQRMMFMSFAAPVPHPATIVIGADNENNAHSGKPDGDIDVSTSAVKANYPIEVSFTLDNLPTQSAYIAIKALDVDEEAGEKDYVFINDAPAGIGVAGSSIGALSGNNNLWNTTVLQIPLSKLKTGKNYVSVTVSKGWYVTVDWLQLILDGGAVDANVSDFSIKLDDAVQNGSNVEIASTINITQSGSTEYYTEYTLNNSAGDNLASYFGSATGVETASLSMPLNSPTGKYTVTGLIKDKVTEEIKASDTITFDFVQGEVPSFGPKVSHTLSPSTLTNGNVTVQLSALNSRPDDIKNVRIWYAGGDITAGTSGSTTTANQSISANGNYTFTIKYLLYGVGRSTDYTVAVSNIDKVGPVITAANVDVAEDTADADVLAAINRNITVTDDVSLSANFYTVSPNSNFASTLNSKTITITANDTAGNQSSRDITLTVLPRPVQITQNNVSVNGAALSASLSAILNYTGGLNISESGFVWGVSQNPTYEVCSGKATTAGSVSKNGSINATATAIAAGVNYYARAYVKSGSQYYYSDQKSFGIGAPQNGSFSVSTDAEPILSGGGTAEFTISRPSSQTEGSQTVYYRTVNGTAIGGVHFVHNTGTLTFAEGEHTKTVNVTVDGVSRQYGSKPATLYQNNERTFYLEIYRVEGGATIGTKNAKRNIAPDSGKQATAEAYNDYNSVGNINSTQYFIRDDGYAASAGARDTVSFSSLQGTDTTYLDATADHYALKYDLDIWEDDDGYQWMQVTDNNTEFYFVRFDHNKNSYDPARITYRFPMTTNAEAAAFYSNSLVAEYRGTLTDSNHAINIGKIRTLYVNYDASGDGDDDWYKDEFKPYVRAVDTKEPQFVAVAPMAGGTYAYGDEVHVSLIFDEIIGSVSGVTVNTNLSDTPFTYLEGLGTNVLVFKGTVTHDSQSFNSVEVSSINGSSNIRDLADYAGTPTGNVTGSTVIDVNTIRPSINFTGSTTGTLPRHNAQVGIVNAQSAKYAWTNNPSMPVSGWTGFANAAGGTLTETLSNGSWYLHVLATHLNGNTRWESKEFIFSQPAMTVTVNNTGRAQSRSIALTVGSGTPVRVAMTGAGTGTYTTSQNINVTANGTYTFTLTDGYGSNIVKSVDVSGIDRTNPAMTINEYGNTATKYISLDFGVTAADEDGGSGMSSLSYKWAASSAVPSSGWISIAAAGGSIPTYSTAGTAYLHIKAVDNAGNTAYACSQGYTVVNNTPPTIQVTGTIPAAWQKDSIELTYTVNKASGNIVLISAGDTVMQDTSLPGGYPYTGSITISQNGLYTFMVTDDNSLSDIKKVLVNYIDKEAPVVSFSYGTGKTSASWAQSKTVTVTASDNTSSVVDSNGAVTGYSGSGLTSLQWKKKHRCFL